MRKVLCILLLFFFDTIAWPQNSYVDSRDKGYPSNALKAVSSEDQGAAFVIILPKT